jgi:hypothetical protein
MASAVYLNLYKETATEKKADNFYSRNLGGGLTEAALDQWKLTRTVLLTTSPAMQPSPVWQDSQ